MMTDGRHFLYAVLLGAALLLVGSGVLVWPAMRNTVQTRREIAQLQQKIADLDEQTDAVERLAEEVKEARQRVSTELKAIPEQPELAKVMGRLHLPVDQRTVIDQTFSAGSPTEAVMGKDYPEKALPLTMEINATFESVFTIIRAAEMMDRLVRVSSVRIAATRAEEAPGASGPRFNPDTLNYQGPLVAASVGLEVIYQPPAAPETPEP